MNKHKTSLRCHVFQDINITYLFKFKTLGFIWNFDQKNIT
jgi:hypothetical protein